MLTYEPASFWRENVIIIVIQLRVFAETSQSNVRGFVILRQGEGSTSFNKDNSGNLSGEKKVNWNFPMSRTRSRSRLTSNLKVPSFTWLGTTTTCVRKECDRYCFYIRTEISFGLYENKQESMTGMTVVWPAQLSLIFWNPSRHRQSKLPFKLMHSAPSPHEAMTSVHSLTSERGKW